MKQGAFFVFFVSFVLRTLPLRVDYLAIAREAAQAAGYEINEINEISPVAPTATDYELNEENEKRPVLPSLHPKLWPIPEPPNIVEDMEQWLADGTLARYSAEHTFMYSKASTCINLPQFARNLLGRIGTDDEGPYTWQRLDLAYWTVRCWQEEKAKGRF